MLLFFIGKWILGPLVFFNKSNLKYFSIRSKFHFGGGGYRRPGGGGRAGARGGGDGPPRGLAGAWGSVHHEFGPQISGPVSCRPRYRRPASVCSAMAQPRNAKAAEERRLSALSGINGEGAQVVVDDVLGVA